MIEILFSLGSANAKNSYTVTSATEGGKHYIALDIDEKYIVATSKSNTGKKQIQKWWDEYRADKYKTSEQVEFLLKLISNSKYFDILDTPIDAYKEYLRISNGKSFLSELFGGENPNGIFPKKSFTLMTEWYKGGLEFKYDEYSKNSLDEFNEDVKLEIEKRLISELIKKIKEKYTEPKKIEGLRQIAPRLGSIAKAENDLIPIKRFVDWLEQKQKNISQTKEIENTPLLDLSDTSAPENPYPEIFKNWYAYQMFSELQSLTIKPRTIVADYSFIFHKMKNKDLKFAIKSFVTEPAFIEFLREDLEIDIVAKKLPFKEPENKKQLYLTTLNKYKNDILNEPKKV